MPQIITKCFLTLTARYLQSPICRAQSELNDCIRNGARDCKQESSPLVQEVLQTYTDTCTEGTEMNALYKAHGRCVFEDAQIGNIRCLEAGMAEIQKSFTPQGSGRDMLDNMMRAACRKGQSADVCLENSINKTCGEEAVIFRRKLSDPSVKMVREGCDKLMGNNDYAQNDIELKTDGDSPVSSHAVHHNVAAVSHHASSLYLGAAIDLDEQTKSSAATISIWQNLFYSLILMFSVKSFLSNQI
ncbi:uncharacterized protein TNCV_818701 [Trichonephila clavipes]|nr:uncharacterized protein TNCV_818701 [Trichonephila clavipes]